MTPADERRVLGEPVERLEGRDKVTGAARYAFEALGQDDALVAWPVQATIARGRVTGIDEDGARSLPGVVEVLTSRNAPRLGAVEDGELHVLQDDLVRYRGQVVALIVAETIEDAREAAGRIAVSYEQTRVDAALHADHPGLYVPEQVNPAFPSTSDSGDVDRGLAEAATVVDVTYATPALFNNPMEPHATTAVWADGGVELVDSTQGTTSVAQTVATLFDLEPEQVRVRAEHVGGGFGSKGSPRPNVPLAVMAAKVTGRPVKLAFTRQMMFSLAGYRTPTISRLRLGADAEGRLTAVDHDAVSQTSTVLEFAEQTAVATRSMYASPSIRTRHRVAALDVPTPRWMRAPGECPGMYALESAMDELAWAAGVDPVELRLRNDTAIDPETGLPFSSRQLAACLRRGAEAFGWSGRDPRPGLRREGRFLVGTGVAASVYPAMAAPSGARLTAYPDGRYRLGVNATDIGTGARTVMAQIAAEALGVGLEAIDVDIADSALPPAPVAGGSMGSASWGWAVHKVCARMREQRGAGAPVPGDGFEIVVDTEEEIGARAERPRNAYGAQFVEARVDLDSGEVTVPRMLGVFAAGRILNPRTARSQFLGGMVMGLGMALHEVGELDAGAGDYVNHDLATYHVPAAADVRDLRAEWLEEDDPDLPPTGGKGIGEIGIVGAAAAVANAIWHATGQRIRDLPIQPHRLVDDLPSADRPVVTRPSAP